MKLKHIVGLEEKDTCLTHNTQSTVTAILNQGYNVCLNTEVEVDKEKVREIYFKTHTGKHYGIEEVMFNEFYTNLATAIETGLVVRVKEGTNE